MTGRIELHQETDGAYRIKIVDDLMRTLALSAKFGSVRAALDGVFTFREIAGTAHVIDCTTRETAAGQTRTGN
jgi:hypothetical protein